MISLLVPFFYFWKRSVQFSLIGICIVTCLIISTFSYIRIYRVVRRHQLHINAQRQAVQSSDVESNLNIARLKRSALNTFVFYIALIICYFPLYVSLTLRGLSIMNWQSERQFAYTAVFMNSSINPFFVLLASSRASHGSCKDSEADVMYRNRRELDRIQF